MLRKIIGLRWPSIPFFQTRQESLVYLRGGTALAKCNQLIDRFSEDIDIVLLKQENESSNQLKNKLKKITKIVGDYIPEIEIEGITNKKGNDKENRS